MTNPDIHGMTVRKTLLSAVLLSAVLSCAAEMFNFNTPSTWRQNKHFIPAEDGAMLIKASARLAVRNSISVDPEKTYKFSFQIRRAPDSKKQPVVYLSCIPTNEVGREIYMHNVTPLKGSEGTLVTDCAKDSTDFIVKPVNEKYWASCKSWRVCFNAVKDYSDIPNFAVTNNIQKVEKLEDGTVKVTLRGKAGVAAKAGTAVRITQGGAYMYLKTIKPKAEWETVTATVKGVNAPGWSNTMFPAGPVAFAPVLLANWGSSGSSFEIKNFKVEDL